jgi:hypothetical protein
VLLALLTVVAVEKYEVPDVVGQNRASSLDGKSKLLRIAESGPIQVDNMLCIVTALAKSPCQQGPNVFVDEQANRRHQRPSCARTLASVFVARSSSISFWLS